MITLEDVAEKLLKEGLHLTALELQAELLRNRGQEVTAIKDFFNKSSSGTKFIASHTFSSSTPIKLPQISTFDEAAEQVNAASNFGSHNVSFFPSFECQQNSLVNQ